MTKKAQTIPEISVLNGIDTLVEYLKKHRKYGDVKIKVDAIPDDTQLLIALHSYGLASIAGNFESLIYTFNFVF